MFSKIFVRLICNAMSKHFVDNKLISSNESDIKPGNSCINQLIAIAHDIKHSTKYDMGDLLTYLKITL